MQFHKTEDPANANGSSCYMQAVGTILHFQLSKSVSVFRWSFASMHVCCGLSALVVVVASIEVANRKITPSNCLQTSLPPASFYTIEDFDHSLPANDDQSWWSGLSHWICCLDTNFQTDGINGKAKHSKSEHRCCNPNWLIGEVGGLQPDATLWIKIMDWTRFNWPLRSCTLLNLHQQNTLSWSPQTSWFCRQTRRWWQSQSVHWWSTAIPLSQKTPEVVHIDDQWQTVMKLANIHCCIPWCKGSAASCCTANWTIQHHRLSTPPKWQMTEFWWRPADPHQRTAQCAWKQTQPAELEASNWWCQWSTTLSLQLDLPLSRSATQQWCHYALRAKTHCMTNRLIAWSTWIRNLAWIIQTICLLKLNHIKPLGLFVNHWWCKRVSIQTRHYH